MNSPWRYYWESLRTSYWFLPAVLGLSAIVASVLTVELDHLLHEHAAWQVDWRYTGGPEGARAVLATIAGSMITVAGVVFSITIVALSLASAQFGPRLLRNFIRDRRNQFVLGTFTATFLYCLLILRTVRGVDHERFVPGVSVTFGILLAIINLGVLIYFIHHVAVSIQAAAVVQAVTEELYDAINRLWPEECSRDEPPAGESLPLRPENEAAMVVAGASGYVDVIDDEALVRLAKDADLVIRLTRRAGHFAIKGTRVALVWPRERVDEDVTKRINKAFVFASQRTPFQDVEFAIDQLVEVAVRALSPGVNDPFTALNCIDRLGETLGQLARRPVPSSLRFDDVERLRVMTYPADYRAIVDAAFNQIRQYGESCAAVLIRLLETLNAVAGLAHREGDRDALFHHAELVHRAAHRSLKEMADLSDVEAHFQLCLQNRSAENESQPA